MKILKQKLQAFTLVESLVSIAIVLIAATAPLTLTFNAITTTIYNKNRLIASYLASQTVEDLRAYRDSFSIACTDLEVNYGGDEGSIIGATCDKGLVSGLDAFSIVKNGLLPNQEVAWDLYLTALGFSSGETTKTVYIDSNSFHDFDPSYSLSDYGENPGCQITLDTNKGYACNVNPNYTDFSEKVVLTKVNDSSLKVQVIVVYARSKLFGLGDKSVDIVDYIYER